MVLDREEDRTILLWLFNQPIGVPLQFLDDLKLVKDRIAEATIQTEEASPPEPPQEAS